MREKREELARYKYFGIVLSGISQVIKTDAAGRQMILSVLASTDLFGEVLACADIKKSPVTITAASKCEVLFIDFNRVVHLCSNACEFHSILIKNMLRVIARKNLELNRKINYLSLKGMREKLSAFMLDQAEKNGSMKFKISMSRSELADYLNVDRSAMSRELSRMKHEGILETDKNLFIIRDVNYLI